jgi:hypothetical protein
MTALTLLMLSCLTAFAQVTQKVWCVSCSDVSSYFKMIPQGNEVRWLLSLFCTEDSQATFGFKTILIGICSSSYYKFEGYILLIHTSIHEPKRQKFIRWHWCVHKVFFVDWKAKVLDQLQSCSCTSEISMKVSLNMLLHVRSKHLSAF